MVIAQQKTAASVIIIFFIVFSYLVYYLLYNSCSFQLLALFLVLTDEALDEDVLVADAPTLVYDDDHKHEHHHNEGGSKGNCEDKCYIHTF
jgi:hypothetical protein